MKLLTLFILLLICLPVFGPNNNLVFLRAEEPVNIYDRLINAIVMVESENGQHLYNDVENAVGYFQIRPIRVLDYNQRTGSDYKLEDFYSYELSREMFLYYTKGRSFERVAKSWNGSGPMTVEYWKLIKAIL